MGTLTTLSNLLRMLYSRAGSYPEGTQRLEAEAFSPNTAAGACPECHGLGEAHDVAEDLLVPDPSLTVREGAIAAWPGAWQGKNLVRVTRAVGIDVDVPWRDLPRKDRDWLLYTDEQPRVLVDRRASPTTRPAATTTAPSGAPASTSATTLADTKSQMMRDKALRFVRSVRARPAAARGCAGTRSR